MIKPTQTVRDLINEYKEKFGHCPVIFWNPIGVRVPAKVTNEELEENMRKCIESNKDDIAKIYPSLIVEDDPDILI